MHGPCRCNLAPSSPVDILVLPGGSDNATNYDWRPSCCRRGTSCIEHSDQGHHLIYRRFVVANSLNLSALRYMIGQVGGVINSENNEYRGYRGGSPTAVQAWQPCPLWEPSPSHPILL